MQTSTQLELFTLDRVLGAYADGGAMENAALYDQVCVRTGVPRDAMEHRKPIGVSGQRHSLAKRRIRWHQQTAKKLGLLEKVPGRRGAWRLTGEGERKLGRARPGVALIAFSTDLGMAIWGAWEDVFPKLDEPIALLLSSPPFPLARPRAYGNPTQQEYVDFICTAMEPIVRNLLPGGSIVLNVSQDIFEPGLPSRSLYLERMVLALHDRLGLHLMDRIPWINLSKAPAPFQWASRTRQQLNVAWEPIYWFTNSPKECFSDNRRVLEPHTETHKKLLAQGGEQRERVHSDGAYRLRKGSFGNATEGRIPRNVLQIGHSCSESQRCNRYAKEHGLQAHGAPMPLTLADKLVRFLTKPGQLVADNFAGKLTTAKAAEMNGRRWLCTEREGDYIASGAPWFQRRRA
jgi:site-specific DNA-methyltransferase (cytosine-N4-specific)